MGFNWISFRFESMNIDNKIRKLLIVENRDNTRVCLLMRKKNNSARCKTQNGENNLEFEMIIFQTMSGMCGGAKIIKK